MHDYKPLQVEFPYFSDWISMFSKLFKVCHTFIGPKHVRTTATLILSLYSNFVFWNSAQALMFLFSFFACSWTGIVVRRDLSHCSQQSFSTTAAHTPHAWDRSTNPHTFVGSLINFLFSCFAFAPFIFLATDSPSFDSISPIFFLFFFVISIAFGQTNIMEHRKYVLSAKCCPAQTLVYCGYPSFDAPSLCHILSPIILFNPCFYYTWSPFLLSTTVISYAICFWMI